MSRRFQTAELTDVPRTSVRKEDAWRVAIRVDARAEIGIGHFMRCLSLADGIARRHGRVRLVSRGLPPQLRDEVVRRGFELANLADHPSTAPAHPVEHAAWLGASQAEDAAETMRALEDHHWDWLVVDHYAIDAAWERVVRPVAARVLVIDDLADRAHDCDLLLDQNLYLDQDERYRSLLPSDCRTLLGPRYSLLRAEFAAQRPMVRRRGGSVARILIAFGGVDAENLTAQAISAVALAAPDAVVDVVIGTQHPERQSIEEMCRARNYHCHVGTTRMAELMRSADLSVGAGGAALWERCCMGLPALARRVAANQRRQVDDAAECGLLYAPVESGDASSDLALHLRTLIQNPALLRHISTMGMQAVDGLGVDRVLRRLGTVSVAMRRAAEADSSNLYAWRNDDSVRATSREHAPIQRAQHEAWLARTLADPQRVLLVGEENGTAVGVVRFDIAGDEAEVSIYLVPGRARVGLGSELLLAAESWMSRERIDLRRLRAEVLGSNERSHRLFRSNGYEARSTVYQKNIFA